ncbi:MAG: hypothetical protein WCJ30_03145, partial [Deltaproteobacteria bacterium]
MNTSIREALFTLESGRARRRALLAEYTRQVLEAIVASPQSGCDDPLVVLADCCSGDTLVRELFPECGPVVVAVCSQRDMYKAYGRRLPETVSNYLATSPPNGGPNVIVIGWGGSAVGRPT